MSEVPTPLRALEMISSASASTFRCGHATRTCAVCSAHIELAREALGLPSRPASMAMPEDLEPSELVTVVTVGEDRVRNDAMANAAVLSGISKTDFIRQLLVDRERLLARVVDLVRQQQPRVYRGGYQPLPLPGVPEGYLPPPPLGGSGKT